MARTYGSDVASAHEVVRKLRDETGLAHPAVPTQQHLDQIIVVPVSHDATTTAQHFSKDFL